MLGPVSKSGVVGIQRSGQKLDRPSIQNQNNIKINRVPSKEDLEIYDIDFDNNSNYSNTDEKDDATAKMNSPKNPYDDIEYPDSEEHINNENEVAS